MKITLNGLRIKLDPPQRLAMLEVRRIADGLSFKILHESGRESDDSEGEELVPLPPEMFPWAEAEFGRLLAEASQDKDEQFPLVEEIDLHNLPARYRLVPAGLPHDFGFTAGEAFSVFLIGQEMLESIVTAI